MTTNTTSRGRPVRPPYWFTTGGEDLTNDLPTHWRPKPAPPSGDHITEEAGS
jgi:hypothetical protein